VLGCPLYLSEIESAWEDRIHDLAVHSGCGALFDLGDLQTEEFVNPLDDNALAYEESALHHADIIT